MTSKARGGRSVAAVNAIVSVGLVAVLAGVALVVKPPAPPGLAEFAPQASKPITKAPLGQGGAPGSHGGPGACVGSGPCASPTPSPTASKGPGPVPVPSRSGGVASTKQCYAWPDGSVTQTWDPQSPPCIADWADRAKGNGGATSPGVTATTIRIAVPWGLSYDEKQPLVDFFNNRFELYGRRLVLAPFTPQTSDGDTSSDPGPERADAEAAKSLNPFAAIAYPFGQANPKTYTSRLAAARVVTVAGGTEVTVGSEAQLNTGRPFSWTYEPTSDELLATVGTMTCRQLVGHPASRSSDPSVQTRTRTFAIVIPDEGFLPGHLDGVEHLQDTLAACGAGRPRVVEYRRPGGDPSPTVSAMLQLRNEGVTSVIFWPEAAGSSSAGAPQKAASSVGYHPEWILPGWSVNDLAALTGGALDELPNSFGLASWGPIPRLTDRPYYRAFSETTGGQPPEVLTTQGDAYDALYRYLQLIASGVQLAGPNLTPQRFQDALQSAEFPNPGAGARPSYQATVGYADDHVAVDDFAFFWFNRRTPPYTGVVDTDPFCYGQRARRWSAVTWPQGQDPFANGTC